MNKQRIVRAAHGKEQPYFLMLRSVAQNGSLSFEALGLLAELLSKPDHWEIRPETLIRKDCARKRVYRLLNELREAGHIERIMHRDELQRITHVEYLVHEKPLPQKPLSAIRKVALEIPHEKLSSQKPLPQKRKAAIRHSIENKEKEEKGERETASPLAASPSTAKDELQTAAQEGEQASALLAAYCDALGIVEEKLRAEQYRTGQSAAARLASMEATSSEMKDMVSERAAAGRSTALRFIAEDYAGWKSQQEAKPKPRVLSDAERKQYEDALEAERVAWRKAHGVQW